MLKGRWSKKHAFAIDLTPACVLCYRFAIQATSTMYLGLTLTYASQFQASCSGSIASLLF